MYIVSYVIVFAFHPDLTQISRVIIERSFGHSLQEINELSYLTHQQLAFIDREKLPQLKDYARTIYQKMEKIAISEMFSCELKIVADCLFNAKIKSNHLELNADVQRKYEIENPIDWQ